MQTINYRVYLKSGASFDIVDKTNKKTYVDVWDEVLSQTEGKPQTTKCWRVCEGKNNKLYMLSVNDIVCFEKLDK